MATKRFHKPPAATLLLMISPSLIVDSPFHQAQYRALNNEKTTTTIISFYQACFSVGHGFLSFIAAEFQESD